MDVLGTKETCKYAAFDLHLEVLKYAHTHRCPWDDETWEAACSRGHLEGEQVALDRLEVLKYFRDNGRGAERMRQQAPYNC